MRRAFTAGAALVIVISASACVGGPPPPPTDPKDVLVVGDSVGFQVGCYLGHNGDLPHVPPESCPQPGGADWAGTRNGAQGACSFSLGAMLLYTGQLVHESNAACHNYRDDFRALINQHDPSVVVLLTAGWEIIDRWVSPPSGSNRHWSPPPTHQWGYPIVGEADTPEEQRVVNAINRYSAQVQDAIHILRSRGAHVLMVNAPYVSPPCPLPPTDPIRHAWWEAYPTVPPVAALCPDPNNPSVDVPTTWLPPNDLPENGTPYRPSKIKIDQFNQYIQVIKDLAFGSDANVEVYDNHQWFTVNGEYSNTICPPPNPAGSDPAACPDGQTAVTARHPDGGHMTPDGLEIIGCALIPRVRQILGLPAVTLSQCQSPSP